MKNRIAMKEFIRKMHFAGATFAVAAVILFSVLITGCGKLERLVSFGEKIVGKDVTEEMFEEFFYTYSSTVNPPEFQRYRFYMEAGKPYFYHEKREGDKVFLTEEDITVHGTMELSDEEWGTFWDYISKGTVRKREQSNTTGGSGPWLFLYWKGDKGECQQFSFDESGRVLEFEDFCVGLKEKQLNESGNTMIGNPWEDCSAPEMEQALGFVINVPKEAQDTRYSICSSENLGEADFTWQGVECCARMKPTAKFEDISGMYYDWTTDRNGQVSYCDARIMSAEEDGVTYLVCNWYDAVPGMMYSVSTSGENLDGLDIIGLAEQIFKPLQGDVDGDAETSDMKTSDTDKQGAEERLKEKLEKELSDSDGPILGFACEDYDCDGNYEAFAFTGQVNEGGEEFADEYYGELWFVNDDGVSLIDDGEKYYLEICHVADFGTRKFLLQYEAYATARVTEIYTVRDGKPVEDGLSRVGDMCEPDGNEFTITLSAYDVSYDKEMDTYLGHSWKPYYFRFEGDEFIEDVGVAIGRAEAESLCPKGMFDEIEAQGNTVDSIMLRENGILTVNYSQTDDAGNVDFKNANYNTEKKEYIDAWGTGEKTLSGSDFGGIYSLGIFGP